MTFFSMPEVHNRLHRTRAFRRLVMSSIDRASMIVVPSEAARDTLREWAPDVLPERIRVIPYGVTPGFEPLSGESVQHDVERLRLPASYVLSVGTIEPRKNLDLLVAAYGRLVRDSGIREHLVLAGKPGSAYQALVAQIEAHGLTERVHLLGFVGDTDLRWIYRRARLFVYPSRAEGFGFPPLEAMASGLPVVSTAGSSLEENLKGAAELVPPGDVDALAAAMRRLLQDEALREQRRAEGLVRAAAFRWDETARQIVECYEQLGRART
jgi:alpha-1,3-rhamnosyl/mannosyltransferase